MLDGWVHPDFADVAATLARQIPRGRQAGSAVCVYHRGRVVVDVWGGVRDAAGRPWQADTVAPSFSTGKGVLATLLHVLVEQGRAAYDDPIAHYWPAFGCRGKSAITLRQALCHEAGLYRITSMISRPAEMLDWDHMKAVIANATPAHPPGAAHGYHALTFGWLVGGAIEAIADQPLAEVLARELSAPLGLDGVYFGLPDSAMERRAQLTAGVSGPPARGRRPGGWRRRLARLFGGLGGEFQAALNPFSERFDWNAPETVKAVIPAASGQFTARSLARLYAMLAAGGELDGVRLLTPDRVTELATIHNRSRDRVLLIPMRWRLGYHRVFTPGPRMPAAFGHFGYGGSGAFCDPSRELAVALTLNSGAGTPMGNSNVPLIARAAARAVDRLRGRAPEPAAR